MGARGGGDPVCRVLARSGELGGGGKAYEELEEIRKNGEVSEKAKVKLVSANMLRRSGRGNCIAVVVSEGLRVMSKSELNCDDVSSHVIIRHDMSLVLNSV